MSGNNVLKVEFPNNFPKHVDSEKVQKCKDLMNEIIDFNKVEKCKDPINEIVESDKVEKCRDLINEIIESEDRCFLETVYDYHDYFYGIDSDEIIENFIKNYSSESRGIRFGDDFKAEIIIHVLLTVHGDEDDIAKLIADHSEVIDCDYYIQWNEMASCRIKEMEYQIDVSDRPELEELIATMSDDEIKKAGADRSSFIVYGYPCERIILKLDPESFLESFKSIVAKALAIPNKK